MNGETDRRIMRLALDEAKEAGRKGEVPVGAVVVAGDGSVLSSAHNLRESSADSTAHAEILALRSACAATGGWRLPDASLYVTLEPCAMCMGAAVNARIRRVVFGAEDPRGGALVSNFGVGAGDELNHRVEFSGGVLGAECAELLESFFRMLRGRPNYR